MSALIRQDKDLVNLADANGASLVGYGATTVALSLDELHEVPLFQDQIPFRKGIAVARQLTAGAGWTLIDDTGHTPYGFDAVTPVQINGKDLQLNYDFTAHRVGNFSVTVDEGFASIGLTVGASVGTTSAVISGFAPISGRVTQLGIDNVVELGNLTSQVVDIAAGTIVVTHATQSHDSAGGTAVKTSDYGSPLIGELVCTNATKTGFTLQYTKNLACRIACTTTTPGSEIFTVTENSVLGVSAAWITGTNCVRVTHPAVGNNYPDGVVMLSRDATTRYITTMDTQGSTTTDVFFYDLAGALITAATSSMIFHFMKRGQFPAAIPSATIGMVQRDLVPVDFALLAGTSRNLWIDMTHRTV